MCIRDRSSDGTVIDIVNEPTTIASSTPAEGPPADRAEADTCLLYTSDAADERSSVDLGGRRIIKKKNNFDVRGMRVLVR